MGIENNFGREVIEQSDDLRIIKYRAMTEPEKDGYKCRLNPLFEKIIPDHHERIIKVERVIEEMQYRGLDYQDVVKKYKLLDELRNNNVDK